MEGFSHECGSCRHFAVSSATVGASHEGKDVAYRDLGQGSASLSLHDGKFEECWRRPKFTQESKFINAASLFGANSTTDILLLLTIALVARGCASSQ